MTTPTASRRTCLLIAYWYPPGGGVGVQRPLKFSKYLPELGWNPVVLTTDTPLGIPLDPSLTVPTGLVISRVAPTVRFSRIFDAERSLVTRLLAAGVFVPDPMIGWLPAALRRGIEVIRRYNPEVIIATSPPNSSQLLGWALSMLSGLPLVSDFRDAWLTDPDRNRSLHNRIRLATVERLMEALVIHRASRVLSVSKAILDDFLVRYHGVEPSRFTLIENGFDEDDLSGLKPMDLGLFAIVLTGSMNKAHRAAAPLLRGVSAFLARKPEFRSKTRVHLVGPEATSDRALVATLGLSAIVSFVGWVSHSEALSYQRSASVNVMLWDGPDDTRSQQMMSSKIFEYLAARRPVLAALPATSAAADMLRSFDGVQVVAPADAAGIATALESVATGHAGLVHGATDAQLEPFTRRYQARQLAGVLSLVAGLRDRSA